MGREGDKGRHSNKEGCVKGVAYNCVRLPIYRLVRMAVLPAHTIFPHPQPWPHQATRWPHHLTPFHRGIEA